MICGMVITVCCLQGKGDSCKNDWELFSFLFSFFFFLLNNLTIIVESLLPINFMGRDDSRGKQLKNTVCIYAEVSRSNRT